jgi:hypothetical protein
MKNKRITCSKYWGPGVGTPLSFTGSQKMGFQHKELGGSIFRNDRRDKDSQPTHKGDCKILGVDYWISAWTNETKDGDKYFGLKFEKKEDKYQTGEAAPALPVGDIDEDIPF